MALPCIPRAHPTRPMSCPIEPLESRIAPATLITIQDATLVEGDSGAASMIFLVSLLDRAGSSTVTVDYATVDGTAISTGPLADYGPVNGALTFATGVDQQLIVVPIGGDVVREGDQAFQLQLTNAVNASIDRAAALGTIVDDDPLPVVSISGGSVIEGNSGVQDAVFSITLEGASESPISVDFTTQNGTALAGSDYGGGTITVTFAPTEIGRTVSVPVGGDALAEADETFAAVLSNPAGATLGTTSATMTIRNDEIVATISNSGPQSEGSSGAARGSVVVTLSGSPLAGAPVLVSYALGAGTATAGSDFTLVSAGDTLTFGPGETTKTIEFDILADTRNEADETILFTLTGATNAIVGVNDSATWTILNDDAAPAITISDASFMEGNLFGFPLTFTILLSAASDLPISVSASTIADGTASPGSDFYTVSSQSITFAPGETTKTFTATSLGDTFDEADETFHVVLTAPTNATLADDTALGTILDDDTRSISVSDATIVEGDSGALSLHFTASLNNPAVRTVTLDYATADSTAQAGSDYTPVIGTLVFNPGTTSMLVSIPVHGDLTIEADETFLLQLSNVTNATVADGEAVGRIITDETSYTLTGPAGGVVEGNGTSGGGASFVVHRTGDLSTTGSVDFTTIGNSAFPGGLRPDFTTASGSITFAPGEAEKTITVAVLPDAHFENDETFSLQLTGAVNGVLRDQFGNIATSSIDASATVLNDDALPTVSIGNATVAEGSSGGFGGSTFANFTVTLSAANEAETIRVDFHTIDGTARSVPSGQLGTDFGGFSFSPLFVSPGETTRTISISVSRDNVDENDESFLVKLDSAQVNGSGVLITITDDTGLGSIIDDDLPPVIVFGGGASGDLSIAEGSSGSTPITPILQLVTPYTGPFGPAAGMPVVSEKDVTVAVTTLAGTAQFGSDYTGGASGTQVMTIPAGTSSLALNYNALADTVHEGDEAFRVVLSAPHNATIGDSQATVTILNDDPIPALAVNSALLIEPDAGATNLVFTVSLFGASDRTVTVDYATADGTAKSSGALPDYVAAAGTLSFAPGEVTKTIAVLIAGDAWAEADETFTMTLSGAVNATILADTGTGTVFNGEDSTVGLVVQDARSIENPVDAGGAPIANPTIVFRVELTKAVASAVSFVAATRNGTAVSSGLSDADFVALSQQFTIAAGQIAVNVPVSLKPDAVFEPTESLFLGIAASSMGVAEARSEGRGVILNDDLLFVDARTLHFIDQDGDLTTVQITKGALTAATLTFGPVNPATGGRTLQLLDFTNSAALFNGTNLRITAEPQIGFDASGLATDRRVDVGFIRGGIPDPSTLQWSRGVDFGSITVQGDVGKITAGDRVAATPSILGKLSVQSLGARGTATGAPDNVSEFYSTVNALNVTGDLEGIVKALGSINSLSVGGAIRGSADANRQSGIVFFTGTLGKATIGSIIGGAAPDSGVINGNTNYTAKIGSLHVLGDIVGGTGTRSGRVVAKTIGSIVVDGDVIGGGGSGTDSDGFTPKGAGSGEILATVSIKRAVIGGDVRGGIQPNTGVISSGGALDSLTIGGSLAGGTGAVDSGVVIVNRTLGNLAIGGDVIGAAGERSGSVQVGGTITKFAIGSATTGGDVIGGTGNDSGTISAGAGFTPSGEFIVSGGTIGSGLIFGDLLGGAGDGSGGVQVGGRLSKLDIRGSIIGGNSGATGSGTTQTGFVLAGRLGTMTLGGDLRSGTDDGAGLADSGSIRVHENISSLTIYGSVIGNETSRAVISAGNNGPLTNGVATPAIAKLTVGHKALTTGVVTGGNVSFLDVLAGYGEFGTTSEPRGEARNADAQIRTINFLGDMRATNVVAGADAGADGFFGTDDDLPLEGVGVTDKAGVVSSIAKVIIGGNVLASDDTHGIVAELLRSIKAANLGAAFSLTPGPANDFIEVADGTNVVANEVFVAG